MIAANGETRRYLALAFGAAVLAACGTKLAEWGGRGATEGGQTAASRDPLMLAIWFAWVLLFPPDAPGAPDTSCLYDDACLQSACECVGAPDHSGRWVECQCWCTSWAPFDPGP